MEKFKNVGLSRQDTLKNSRQGNFRDVVYLIQAYNGLNVRTIRTENPARALTVCKPFVEQAYTVQISVWIRVGIDCMIPMTYTACSNRDLANAFESVTRDIACALKSSQIDETREQIRQEEREEADMEVPHWNIPEFLSESGEALER